MKIYPKPESKMISLEDLASEFEIRAKVVFELQCSVGLRTIPQLAQRLNEGEDEVAKALYSACLVSAPSVLILDEGESYFKRVVELANVSELPEFTSETRFYTIRS